MFWYAVNLSSSRRKFASFFFFLCAGLPGFEFKLCRYVFRFLYNLSISSPGVIFGVKLLTIGFPYFSLSANQCTINPFHVNFSKSFSLLVFFLIYMF